jgi:hypothetical protein
MTATASLPVPSRTWPWRTTTASQPASYCSLSSKIMVDRESYYEIQEKTQKGSCDVTGWLV